MAALLLAGAASFLPAPTPLSSAHAVQSSRAVVIASAQEPGRRQAVAALGAAAAALAGLPSAGFAESTAVTRQQAYSRYVPRIERGRDYWAVGLKKSIQTQDWPTIQAALAPKGSIERIFGPMGLWASSMSGKTISPKTVAMNEAIEELREAATKLKIAADGQEAGGGFLGFGGPKKLEQKQRVGLAITAYKSGVVAINKYIELGNDGLGLQFATVDTID